MQRNPWKGRRSGIQEIYDIQGEIEVSSYWWAAGSGVHCEATPAFVTESKFQPRRSLCIVQCYQTWGDVAQSRAAPAQCMLNSEVLAGTTECLVIIQEVVPRDNQAKDFLIGP
jgi:hypothetical protein